jgi:uncharacterized protein with FMN-binding domain
VRKSLASLAAVLALATPAGNAIAALRATAAKAAKKTITVNGLKVECTGKGNKDWGPIVVALVVTKTTTGSKVVRQITDVQFPMYPQHTDRSVYINKQALPLLKEETLQLQFATATRLEMISGATDTTVAFQKSIAAALLAAKKV